MKKKFDEQNLDKQTALIAEDEKFSKSNIKCVRPHFGLHPRYFNSVIEKRSKKDLYKGDRLKLEYVKK